MADVVEVPDALVVAPRTALTAPEIVADPVTDAVAISTDSVVTSRVFDQAP